MNIFIAGGGRVGFHLARLLSLENHNITVIETEQDRLEQIDTALDVSTKIGSAASVLGLREAGAASADLFVSVTGNDEVNLVAAATAKALGAKRTVARVDQPTYVDSSMLYETMLGIDFVLSPEALTAQEIIKYIENPGVVATEDFGRGLIHMRQIRVTDSPTKGRKTIEDVIPPGSGMGVLVGVISRNGEVMIPHGDDRVKPGDLVTLIGHREQMPEVIKLFQGKEPKPRKVLVVGGSSIGLHLAQGLENRPLSVKLLDRNMKQCNGLATLLKKTAIVCRDGTSREDLLKERVEDADVFVATTDDDERNIMACVLAKSIGAAQTIAVVHQPDFAPLVPKLGIDHAVTPRACIANRILKLVHQDRVSSLAVLEEGQVEILELAVTGDAPILGKTLRDIRPIFPRGALIATILRGEKVIVPTGDDEVHADDSMVVIAAADSLDAVQKLFHP
ncbi:MAG TPA: Trk system potassium transporter TrkA [Candidatus Hydrogenedentes bacterium]|nr:Trk system potassium transporter TrkA [Candidatus Hydrogenedentota bacterium]